MHRARHFSSGWVAMDVESTVTDMDPDSSQQTVDRHIETIGIMFITSTKTQSSKIKNTTGLIF